MMHIFDYRRQIFTRLFGGMQSTGAQPSTPAPAAEENIT
jgi:hypothetical protein